MGETSKEERNEFLREVINCLDQSKKAYDLYLANGKTFQYAKRLRDVNQMLRDLLVQQSFLLPENLQVHATNIVEHIDVWRELWDAHAQKKLPKLTDEFVFENTHTFPFESEATLREYYSSMEK